MERGDLPSGFVEARLELEDALHPDEGDAVVRELLATQQHRDVAVGVAPAPPGGAARLNEPLALVKPEGLRMNAREIRRDGNHVQGPVTRVVGHVTPPGTRAGSRAARP